MVSCLAPSFGVWRSFRSHKYLRVRWTYTVLIFGLQHQRKDNPSSTDFVYPDEETTLGSHHDGLAGSITLNVRKCMEYLIEVEGAGIDCIVNDPFAVKHWKLTEKLARQDGLSSLVQQFAKKMMVSQITDVYILNLNYFCSLFLFCFRRFPPKALSTCHLGVVLISIRWSRAFGKTFAFTHIINNDNGVRTTCANVSTHCKIACGRGTSDMAGNCHPSADSTIQYLGGGIKTEERPGSGDLLWPITRW